MKSISKIGILCATLCLIAAVALALCLIVPYGQAESVPQELYFGRNKLSCNNNIVSAYDAICKGVGSKSNAISLNAYNLSKDDFLKVWELYRFDHPEHYWVPSSYGYRLSGNKVTSMEFGTQNPYLTGFDDVKFITESQKYLDLAANLGTEYEKSLVLHDALVQNVTYDTSAKNAHNCYGAIVDKKAVCEGYAEAYQYLLQLCGIQSYIVTGTSHNEGHAWNLVRLDGNYYYTDVTWDDPISANDKNKPVYHGYFNITTAILQEDHSITDTYGVLPICTKTDMLNKDMAVISAYSVESIAKATKVAGKTGTAKIFLTGETEGFSEFLKNQNNFSAIVAQTALAGKSVTGSLMQCGREYILTLTGPDAPATAIFLDKSKLELVVGKDPTATLIATVRPSGYCSDVVVWKSSNPSVATVNQTGTVTAVSKGTAVITATAGAKTARCTVTVAPECDHISKTLVNAIPATCKTTGIKEHYKCNDCGKAVNRNGDEIDPALPVDENNHAGDTEIRNSVSATCQQSGYTGDTYCLDCGKMISAGVEVPQSLHTFDETYRKELSDATKHYHVCAVCGTKDSGEAHDWNIPAATDTENKFCKICAYVAEVATSHTHNVTLHSGTPATCTVAGEKDYYECILCGMFFADADCTEKITDVFEWKIIPPAHTLGEPVFTFSKDYSTATAKFVCTANGCGETLQLDAAVTSEETKKATDTEAGETIYTAQVELDGKTHTETKTQKTAPKLGYFFGGIIRLCTFGGAINGYLGFGLVAVGTLLILIFVLKIVFRIRRKRHRARKNEE